MEKCTQSLYGSERADLRRTHRGSSPGTSAFTAAPAGEHTHFTKAEQQPALVPEQKTREWSSFHCSADAGPGCCTQVYLCTFGVRRFCATFLECVSVWKLPAGLLVDMTGFLLDPGPCVLWSSCVRRCPHSRCCCAHRNWTWSKPLEIRPRVGSWAAWRSSVLTGNIPPPTTTTTLSLSFAFFFFFYPALQLCVWAKKLLLCVFADGSRSLCLTKSG